MLFIQKFASIENILKQKKIASLRASFSNFFKFKIQLASKAIIKTLEKVKN